MNSRGGGSSAFQGHTKPPSPGNAAAAGQPPCPALVAAPGAAPARGGGRRVTSATALIHHCPLGPDRHGPGGEAKGEGGKGRGEPCRGGGDGRLPPQAAGSEGSRGAAPALPRSSPNRAPLLPPASLIFKLQKPHFFATSSRRAPHLPKNL